MRPAVLFARSDSIYKNINGLEVYDIERDARNFDGLQPVIAHPPCRAWGCLKHLARPRHDERELAHFAVYQVRKNGGVLEHPAFSSLWLAAGLPMPGQKDGFNGWTLPIQQFWFGHPARKNTWLYIVGVEPKNIPSLNFKLGTAEFTIGGKKEAARSWREKTPDDLAYWLVDLCERINVV